MFNIIRLYHRTDNSFDRQFPRTVEGSFEFWYFSNWSIFFYEFLFLFKKAIKKNVKYDKNKRIQDVKENPRSEAGNMKVILYDIEVWIEIPEFILTFHYL